MLWLCLQLNRDGEVLKTPQGVLLKTLTKADAGQYHCLATENNFKHTLARVYLRILDRDIAVALTTPDEEEEASRSHRKDHQQDPARPTPALLLEPEMRLIQQYCQSYWEQLTSGGNSQADLPKRANRRHTEALKASGEWGGEEKTVPCSPPCSEQFMDLHRLVHVQCHLKVFGHFWTVWTRFTVFIRNRNLRHLKTKMYSFNMYLNRIIYEQ